MNSKQDHILQTALELFATEGIAVPTAKIAQKAGVANGTLFNYFPTKQALIDALYLNIKKEVAQLFLAAKADKVKSLKECTFILWDNYTHWSIDNPLKHKVAGLFMTADILSPFVCDQMKDIFKPFHQLTEKGIKRGEIKNIGLCSLYQIKAALIGVCIDQALAQKLKGKALQKHIRTSFDIFWQGVGLK